MRRRTGLPCAALLLLCTGPAVPGFPQDSAAAPAQPWPAALLDDVLVIGGVGRAGRTAVHVDAIEDLVVRGAWSAPAAGQTVPLPQGAPATWMAAHAGEDGVLRDAALRGGYAYVAFDCPADGVAILDASAHSLVYVNGWPRAGDPYMTGYVRLPVSLRAGRNELLFACGRGELRAQLTTPRARAFLDLADATVPDHRLGNGVDAWAGVVVVNAGSTPLERAVITARCGESRFESSLPAIDACTSRKVPVRLVSAAADTPENPVFELQLVRQDLVLDRADLALTTRRPSDVERRTFVSEIDGSVQYYAMRVAPGGTEPGVTPGAALFFTLHGAAVEATGQAGAYAPKEWGHVVAPTNRRPYGFDWEDWGRLDALEVLNLALRELRPDPARVYLLGHSMGGHGTWHLGATYPDRFAASAGWTSFWSYAGAARSDRSSAVARILEQATGASDTLRLMPNLRELGIYVLHGDADDNVPVSEAREMREQLARFHPDFSYYERPGAGHWWGSECVDWPPLFAYLREHVRRAPAERGAVDFTTFNPAVSARCDWVLVEAQERSLQPSRVNLRVQKVQRIIAGFTENVAALTLQLEFADSGAPDGPPHCLLAPGAALRLELDGQTLAALAWPADGKLHLSRSFGEWRVDSAGQAPTGRKNPARGGPFKQVFDRRVQLVYGTGGTLDENAWARAKARYDAETFWVRGNGSFDVLADREFRADTEHDRNVVLYGNADTNSAWQALWGNCPLQVDRSGVRLAGRACRSPDIAVLALQPRPGSTAALVGIVSGSGLPGMRLTERLPVFLSGVAYPDWILLDTEVLRDGVAGVRAAGFWDQDWQYDERQSAWRD